MTTEEAIKILEYPVLKWSMEWDDRDDGLSYYAAIELAISALRAKQEAGRYRFYYCESEDSYLLGARVDNFYYAHWDGKSFVWDMSRYLPWGEHIVISETAWKEHTFPSEPKEIGPEEWFRGFLDQRFRQEAENNAPLTLDELRGMRGEPVWLVPLGEDFDEGWYIIVSIDKQRLRCLQLYSILFFEHYGKTWLAYRRKPEEGM